MTHDPPHVRSPVWPSGISRKPVIVAVMTKTHVTKVTNPLTGRDFTFTSTVQYAYVRFILRDDGHVFASKHRTLRQAASAVNLTAALRDQPRTVVRIKDDKVVTPKITRTRDLTPKQDAIKVPVMPNAKTRPATLTHPTTGESFTANYGVKFKYLRFMITSSDNGGPISKHATLDQAVSGPSQTTAWNKYPRVVVEIDTGKVVFDGRTPQVPSDADRRKILADLGHGEPAPEDVHPVDVVRAAEIEPAGTISTVVERHDHVPNCGCKLNREGDFYVFMNSECAALRRSLQTV